MTPMNDRRSLLAGVVALAVALVGLALGLGTREAAAEPSCNDPGTALPVVVVHGFTSNAAAMAELIAILEGTQIEVAVEAFDYGAQSTSWVTHNRIGPKLRERLICLADASLTAGGLGRVAVVGHSMGGLATRYALSTDGGDGRGPLIEEIALVVTIGTPHEGSLWGNVAGPASYLQRSLITQMWGQPAPLAGSSAASALAVGSSRLGELPDFPDDVPVLALASEYIGQPRLLFFSSPELRVGDAVVARSSALARSREIDGRGGTDAISCRISLPLELGMASISAAVAAELAANPAAKDCGHVWQHKARRLVGGINAHLAVASSLPPRLGPQEDSEAPPPRESMSQVDVANAFYAAFLRGDAAEARKYTKAGQSPDAYDDIVHWWSDPEYERYLAPAVECRDGIYCGFTQGVDPTQLMVVEQVGGLWVVTGVGLGEVGPVIWTDQNDLVRYCVTDTTPLNLRTYRGTEFAAMTAIPVGDCEVFGEAKRPNRDWMAVRWNDRVGYVAARMLTPASALETDGLEGLAHRFLEGVAAASVPSDIATQEAIDLATALGLWGQGFQVLAIAPCIDVGDISILCESEIGGPSGTRQLDVYLGDNHHPEFGSGGTEPVQVKGVYERP
jgi:pimeloyl-ACP methyl ester carboxylesterase